jgi:hypothetical protein
VSESKLTPLDAYVVMLGKCLEYYSSHYPKVYQKPSRKQTVSIEEALGGAELIVGELLQGPAWPSLREEKPAYKKRR